MEKSFLYQGSSVSYRVVGSGKAAVLLHGFGEDSHIWDKQIAFLQNDCMLIVPDIPGSGKSEMLTPYEANIDDYAACIHALLLQEQVEQCTMLGHSMGGYITLAFAEKYPEKLTAFGLINSTAFADSDEKKKTRQRAIETIENNGVFPFLRITIPSLFGEKFKKEHPEKIEQLIQASHAFTAASLQQYYRAMMNRPDRTHVLKSNPLPILFVTATEDGPAPMNDVLQQSHLPDKSYIYILENVGHMSMWEATDELNRHILHFINTR